MRIPILNFINGLVTPLMDGMVNHPMYSQSLIKAENIDINPTGQIVKRPGTIHQSAMVNEGFEANLFSLYDDWRDFDFYYDFADQKLKSNKHYTYPNDTTIYDVFPDPITNWGPADGKTRKLQSLRTGHSNDVLIVFSDVSAIKVYTTIIDNKKIVEGSEDTWLKWGISPAKTGIIYGGRTLLFFDTGFGIGLRGSKIGLWNNFTTGTNPDDAVEFTLSGTAGQTPLWVLEHNGIILATTNGIYHISGGPYGITPTDIQVKKLSSTKPSDIPGQILNGEIIFIPRSKKSISKLVEVELGLFRETSFTDHINMDNCFFDQFLVCDDPSPRVFALMKKDNAYYRNELLQEEDDFITHPQLLVIFRDPLKNVNTITNWTFSAMRKRYIQNIAIIYINNKPYLQIFRWSGDPDLKGIIERLNINDIHSPYDDQGFDRDRNLTIMDWGKRINNSVDESNELVFSASSTSRPHEDVYYISETGKTGIAKYMDAVQPGYKKYVFEHVLESYEIVIIGIPINVEIKTPKVNLPGYDGITLGVLKRFSKLFLNVASSMGGKVSVVENDEKTISYDVPLGSDYLYTGQVEIPIDSGHDPKGNITIKHTDPYPFTLCSIIAEVEVYERN